MPNVSYIGIPKYVRIAAMNKDGEQVYYAIIPTPEMDIPESEIHKYISIISWE